MSEQNGPTEGPGWWPPAQSWKSSATSSSSAIPSTRTLDAGKNVSVTTINVPPAQEMHDGKILLINNKYYVIDPEIYKILRTKYFRLNKVKFYTLKDEVVI